MSLPITIELRLIRDTQHEILARLADIDVLLRDVLARLPERDRLAQAREDIAAVMGMRPRRDDRRPLPPYLEYGPATTAGVGWPETTDTVHYNGEGQTTLTGQDEALT